MARTRDDAKATAADAAADITRQPTEDAGVKKTPGRSRGRPKSANPKSPAKPYVPTGRPRGRPKGSFKSKAGEERAKKPKKPAAPLAPGQTRGRGRPRKSDVVPAQEDNQEQTAESEANAEAEAGDDAAENQPGIGGKSNRRQHKAT
ncbi:hypothetical protein TsFJ059_006136 [Trichoderma semiorbis]|uniref:AT hook domain-containing protein n=1 Tax=Trichoderma semiorbis TaxID=1491008 RepID=A0A9P8H9L6_9HYPO|nr:hypothetical protein TsFJ059_006136 [Trichoderma semiorbis]